MDADALIPYLTEKHPGAFEGWDKHELAILARERKGEEPLMLAILYNKGDGKTAMVDIHAAFLLTSAEDGSDIIRVGGAELVQEYHRAYVPGYNSHSK